MRIQANAHPAQAQEKAFMQTFFRVLDDEEENELQDRAFDTYFEQSLEQDSVLDKVPPILAALTFNEAKSSLSGLMPKADLAEIREASLERPEVAKWVSLLDSSSKFLKAVAERAPTTITPEPGPWHRPPVVGYRPAPVRSTLPPVLQETENAQEYGEAKKLLSEAASLSERAWSEYSDAGEGAKHAESSMDSSTSGLSSTEERDLGSAIANGGQSAESSGSAALSSAELALDFSSDTENALSSAMNLLSEHDAAYDLRRLLDSCREARKHGQEGIKELQEASDHLRNALSNASYLTKASEEADLFYEAWDARRDASNSHFAYSDGANDFQDAAGDQLRVSEGLQRILSSLD